MRGPPPIITSFWHGPLSWLERLSIASFIRHGHPFHLYTYDDVEGLPEGAERRNANDVLPQDEMFFYKGKHTPAVFADLFRLKLMQIRAGIWADCDVYCVKSFAGMAEYVFGYEVPAGPDGKGGSVNNAVFQCPPESELLAQLLAIFAPENAGEPMPWLPPIRRLEVAFRRLLGHDLAPQNVQFGATGPLPLTWHVRRLGLIEFVQPTEVFYPVPYTGIPALMLAGSDINTAITPQTRSVHLWRSQLTRRGRAEIGLPEPGSALAKLCEKEGIAL